MIKKKTIIAIVVYFIIAVVLRYLTNIAYVDYFSDNNFFGNIAQALGPAIGALVVCLLFGFKFPLTLQGDFKSIAIPFALYWILPIALISGQYYISGQKFNIVLIIATLVYGLLEEIGWRGFLYQALKPLPKVYNILIVATLWFVWHLTIQFTLPYLIFFVILVLGSWGIGLIADRTRSLLAIAAIHSLNNFYHDYDTQKIIVLIVLLVIWIISIKKFDRYLS